MQWIRTDDIQTGDIVETPSKIPQHSPILKGMMLPIIKHYGIIIIHEDEPYIVHNIIGRRPTITPCSEVFTDRKIGRVLRTGMDEDHILEKFDSCKERPYNLFSWNCESLMTFITGSSIGIPQRDAWSYGAVILIAVILVLLFSRKKTI